MFNQHNDSSQEQPQTPQELLRMFPGLANPEPDPAGEPEDFNDPGGTLLAEMATVTVKKLDPNPKTGRVLSSDWRSVITYVLNQILDAKSGKIQSKFSPYWLIWPVFRHALFIAGPVGKENFQELSHDWNDNKRFREEIDKRRQLLSTVANNEVWGIARTLIDSDLQAEIDRVEQLLQEVGQDPLDPQAGVHLRKHFGRGAYLLIDPDGKVFFSNRQIYDQIVALIGEPVGGKR